MTPAQRALVTLSAVSGVVWLLAGSERPTGRDFVTACWILLAVLAVLWAVALYVGVDAGADQQHTARRDAGGQLTPWDLP
ncbi:hypothetical protein ACIA47_12675 [Micromonospora sp. NPDC051227]|uniref:hypothetical protein n=1 Tax=Micromonospora sp. NPDC051227 TaxID=3364285 RepID=UPI0037A9ACC0